MNVAISHRFNTLLKPNPSFVGAPEDRQTVHTGQNNFVANQLQARRELHQGFAGFMDPVTVAVIDDFVPEDNGFNHGAKTEGLIKSGAQGPVDTLRFNIDKPGQDRTVLISNALGQLIQKAQRGEKVDVVNISQQAFGSTATTRKINQQIDQLEAMGVTVVVAAGNKPGQVNELARTANIVVENADENGNRASTSGVGNIRFNGNSTSEATANFTAKIASGVARPKSQAFRAAFGFFNTGGGEQGSTFIGGRGAHGK